MMQLDFFEWNGLRLVLWPWRSKCIAAELTRREYRKMVRENSRRMRGMRHRIRIGAVSPR